MEPAINRRPAITGVGLLTVLGKCAEKTWEALVAGRSISDHARVQGFSGPDRAILMAEHASAEALNGAGWKSADRGSDDTAIFVGTSKGTIESWMGMDAELPTGLSRIDSALARKLKFGNGPRMTNSCACSSGLHALVRAALAIESGEARRALVVAVEASVHPLFISSFRRLGVLAPEGHGCRPFDHKRAGFVISEAAAAVCLEAAEESIGRPIVRIDRWGAGSDGTHLTAGDPAGKALRHLLQRVVGSDCDLVHAHATGTRVNDPVELAAIEAAAGQSQPVLYSHKGAMGHSLGAAGLVSVVLNCLAHSHAKAPPNIRSTEPLPMSNVRFSSEVVHTSIKRSVAIAAGFGGPLACVSLVSC